MTHNWEKNNAFLELPSVMPEVVWLTTSLNKPREEALILRLSWMRFMGLASWLNRNVKSPWQRLESNGKIESRRGKPLWLNAEIYCRRFAMKRQSRWTSSGVSVIVHLRVTTKFFVLFITFSRLAKRKWWSVIRDLVMFSKSEQERKSLE